METRRPVWILSVACLVGATGFAMTGMWTLQITGRSTHVQASGGTLGVWLCPSDRQVDPTRQGWSLTRNRTDLDWWNWGKTHLRKRGSVPNQAFLNGVHARAPLWPTCLILGIPAVWLYLRKRNQSTTGCCAWCGYDLTGNVSGVCSECGEQFWSPI